MGWERSFSVTVAKPSEDEEWRPSPENRTGYLGQPLPSLAGKPTGSVLPASVMSGQNELKQHRLCRTRPLLFFNLSAREHSKAAPQSPISNRRKYFLIRIELLQPLYTSPAAEPPASAFKERYYKKQCLNPLSNISGSTFPSNILSGHPPPPSNIQRSPYSSIPSSSKQSEATEIDEILANLPADPGHSRILDYPPNYHEAIRRHYLQNDPCQPRNHIMPRRVSDKRCFIIGWFDKFRPSPSQFLASPLCKMYPFFFCKYHDTPRPKLRHAGRHLKVT
ncbi:hypothetical protein DVH24_010159 [Malus domestica]|uniref:Uncharacterized protein n=1 Tax=Malus domestica TaxID=3750 RepID=A0A498JVJ3_MALDO|nr:hypothetical protein DVH24_010159 [Malus domestica]